MYVTVKNLSAGGSEGAGVMRVQVVLIIEGAGGIEGAGVMRVQVVLRVQV